MRSTASGGKSDLSLSFRGEGEGGSASLGLDEELEVVTEPDELDEVCP